MREFLRTKARSKAALGHLASAGVLTYIEASDSIVLRAAEEPEGEPMAES